MSTPPSSSTTRATIAATESSSPVSPQAPVKRGPRRLPSPACERAAQPHLVGEVVAVLLGVEPAPAAVAQARDPRAEEPVRPRVAVGHVHAGDLVVALVGAEAAV